jgi:CBS domain containing-hemolysin-like protein
MVQRTDIIAAEESIAFSDLLDLFREAQHSRLPIYRETLDEPVGLVHLKDLVALMVPQGDGGFRMGEAPIADILRPILFVPSAMPVMELLQKMQAAHTHLALVIDEYGGTDGLVSIEDLIEEIVGDISDEHDEETKQVRPLAGGAWLADGRIDLEDFKIETGIALDLEEEPEVETLGGVAVALLGRVPEKGEIVLHPAGYELEILNADPRRVKLLRVRATDIDESKGL